MADVNLSITIPEALVPRIQEALGVNTKVQFEAWVKERVKAEVISYEARQADEAERAKVKQAEQARQTAVETASETAEAEIVL